METQCIDDHVALICNCSLLENAQDVEEIRHEIMECVNAYSNESEKLNQNLLKEIDEVIIEASNTNEALAYDEKNSDSEFVEMQDMHGCLKEEDVIILEILNSCSIQSCQQLNSVLKKQRKQNQLYRVFVELVKKRIMSFFLGV